MCMEQTTTESVKMVYVCVSFVISKKWIKKHSSTPSKMHYAINDPRIWACVYYATETNNVCRVARRSSQLLSEHSHKHDTNSNIGAELQHILYNWSRWSSKMVRKAFLRLLSTRPLTTIRLQFPRLRLTEHYQRVQMFDMERTTKPANYFFDKHVTKANTRYELHLN